MYTRALAGALSKGGNFGIYMGLPGSRDAPDSRGVIGDSAELLVISRVYSSSLTLGSYKEVAHPSGSTELGDCVGSQFSCCIGRSLFLVRL